MVTQRVDEYLDCFLPLWFEVYLKKFYLSWCQRCRPSAKRGKFLCFFWLRRQPEGEMNVLCLGKGRNNTSTQQHPPLLFGSVSLNPTVTVNTKWTRKPRDWCGTMTFHCSWKNPLCLWIFFFWGLVSQLLQILSLKWSNGTFPWVTSITFLTFRSKVQNSIYLTLLIWFHWSPYYNMRTFYRNWT